MSSFMKSQFISPKQCKICKNTSTPFDVVDFNKSCEEIKGKYLPLSGVPVYYFKCTNCGFLFTPMFDDWSKEEFKNMIYNDGYESVDPDYLEHRPKTNAMIIEQLFNSYKNVIPHIDYGGGNGLLSSMLQTMGWKSTSYDPLVDTTTDIKSLGKFQLITTFEVFEHSPDPEKLMNDLELLIDENGLILFSTLVSDGSIELNKRLDWWYAAPRNGHISLYSQKSLSMLLGKPGFKITSFSPGAHAAFREVPYWAKHLFQK